MPGMCVLDNFSGVFEVAFGLSAVFYYVELRKLAEDKAYIAKQHGEKAIKAGVINILSSRKLLIDLLLETLKQFLTQMSFTIFDVFSLGRNGLIRMVFAFGAVVVGYSLIWISGYLAHALAFLSTGSALGALLYIGYNSGDELSCRFATYIVIASFASITWNLLIYFITVPLLSWFMRRTAQEWSKSKLPNNDHG